MTKPKEGAITTKEGNKFIYIQGKWYRPNSIPAEMKGSETVKRALANLSTKPAPKATPKPAPKPKPTAAKPASKPAPKPKPAAAKTAPKPAAKEYYGPGGKPKRASLKEQVADLKKSGTGSERFKEMAEKARKDMMEKRRKKTQQRGSRKPGSMY